MRGEEAGEGFTEVVAEYSSDKIMDVDQLDVVLEDQGYFTPHD